MTDGPDAATPSPDGRFWLERAGSGARLRFGRGGRVLLELCEAGCRLDVCTFDAGGRALLHLRLSRIDGSLAMYPATLDLLTGLFYPADPRHCHAAAGSARDLERIAAGQPPPRDTEALAPADWPTPAELAAAERIATPPDSARPEGTPPDNARPEGASNRGGTLH